LLAVEGGPGLSSALTGATSIAAIARSTPDRCFAYLPAGDSAVPLSGLRRIPTFRRLLRKVTAGGGTLLLYAAEEDLAAFRSDDADGPTFDGCIALGSVPDLALELGAPLLARVERPAEGPAPPSHPESVTSGESAAGRPVAAASKSGLLRRLWFPVLAVLLWAMWTVVDSSGESEAGTEPPAAASTEPDGSVAGDSSPATPRPRVWAAPSANFSVLVGSYVRLRDAEERRDALSADGGLFFVSPTPVRGRVYFRVFAGVYEDRVDAVAAMERLVDDGRKETVKVWDVRPVRLAHDLGTFDSLEAASERIRELRDDGIPAYVLRDSAAVSSFRVYAGAFESEEAAATLGELLASREVSVELETRSGVAP
ncbi:MAG: SPOR domain-containing protein, partial [Gemmatimonadota bacterium]